MAIEKNTTNNFDSSDNEFFNNPNLRKEEDLVFQKV